MASVKWKSPIALGMSKSSWVSTLWTLKQGPRTKEILPDGKPNGVQGSLSERQNKHLQMYQGLAIRQNTLTEANPTDREVDVALCTMKKNFITIPSHHIHSQDPTKEHHFCPTGRALWCKWQQDSLNHYRNIYLPGLFVLGVSWRGRAVSTTLSERKLLQRSLHATESTLSANHKLLGVKVTILLCTCFCCLPLPQGRCQSEEDYIDTCNTNQGPLCVHKRQEVLTRDVSDRNTQRSPMES